LRSREESNTPSANTQVTTSTVAPSVQIFRTSHFQFQAGKSWSEIAGETTKNKYVYRNFQSTLIRHELNIYVNPETIPPEPTYVLPVTVSDKSRLQATDISEHCVKGVPSSAPKDPQKITFASVSFICSPDSASYIVIVGEQGADPILTMRRPNGQQADYIIVYRDVTAKPDASELLSIVESFQTR